MRVDFDIAAILLLMISSGCILAKPKTVIRTGRIFWLLAFLLFCYCMYDIFILDIRSDQVLNDLGRGVIRLVYDLTVFFFPDVFYYYITELSWPAVKYRAFAAL